MAVRRVDPAELIGVFLTGLRASLLQVRSWLPGRIEVTVDGIWAFLALTLMLSLSPGPDDFLVLRSSLRGGPRLGLATVAGIAAGSLAWGAAAALGLGALVAESASAHDVLRVSGACYLVALGMAPLLAEVIGRRRPGRPASDRRSGGAGGAFASGLLSDVLNPKIGLFYVAVVPQFVPAGAPAVRYALLCAIDVAVAVVWLSVLAWLAHAAVRWLLLPRVVVWSQRVTSVALVGLGASAAVGW